MSASKRYQPIESTMPRVAIMSEDAVCEFLGVSRKTLQKWRHSGRFCREGKLPNGKVVFKTVDVETWVEGRFSRW